MSSCCFLVFLLILFQTFFLTFPSPSTQLCLHDERHALLQLKENQYHVHPYSNHHPLESWKLNTDCCYWEGITCDNTTGHVVDLDLSGSSLGRYIHSNSCLFHLRHLQTLDLSRNTFEYFAPSGFERLTRYFQLEIPDLGAFVQNLSSLRVLRLDGVNLSGQKNRDWCHHLSSSLPNLQVLSMINCSLAGPLDESISSLHFLSELHLDLNPNLSSTIPSSLLNLTDLTILSLINCGFHGDFPNNVFLQPNLWKIFLTGNPLLSVHLPEFPQVNNSLTYMGIGNTKIQGKLPSSIGNLKFLKELYLWGCNFSGQIPSSLANLTHLTVLVLSSNSFSGQIPSFFNGTFSDLEILYLDENLLHGSIPSYLFFLPSLRMLDLSNNQFNGFIDDLPYNSLPINHRSDKLINGQIQLLWLRSCNISKFPNFLRNQKELTRLDLSYNRISKFPDFLRDLKALRDLDISSNRIDGAVPRWIWKKNLSLLNFSNNLLIGLELPLPNYSFNIEAIDLHSNKIQDCLPKEPCFPQTTNQSNNDFVSPILGNLTFLLSKAIFFSISNNKLIGKIPFSICNAHNLNLLELSNNQLSGTIPTCLGNSNLGVLNLESNKLHGPIPSTIFRSGCGLHTLKLNKNMLQGQVPISLANCKELEVLDIGDNQLNGTFPYWLENLSKLRVLVMRSNNLGGPIGQLSHVDSPFPNLHVFDISFNTFTGNLPLQYILHWKAMMTDDDNSILNYISFQNSGGYYYRDTIGIVNKGKYLEMGSILNTFTTVDLSNNKFHGGIPDAMGDLKSLVLLNLSGNNLTGQIPPMLGNLSKLEALDLSRNNLSGQIPSQLTSLTFLSILNLSDNNLIGSIPQGKQFDTFLNTSYEGNTELCGSPLSRKCEITDKALPPMLTLQQEEDSTCLLDWKFVIAGYCFGLIIGVVAGQQLFWRKNQFLHGI